MGKLLLQLGNNQNWQQLYGNRWTALRLDGDKKYVPIPAQTLPVLAERRILVVGGASADALGHWTTAGWLIPKLYISGVSYPFLEANLKTERVPLNDYQLIILPDFGHAYRLEFRIPRWLKEVELDLWQYVGEEKDSTDELLKQLAPQWGYFT